MTVITPAVLADAKTQQALGQWIKSQLDRIKATKNLQLGVDVGGGGRNPLLAPKDAVDPCWKTTILYEEKDDAGTPLLKMALLAWNPGCLSKIHDHPLACWEAHVAGPPLVEVPFSHPRHATVQALWASSRNAPGNANRWVVRDGDLVPGEARLLTSGDVAFDSAEESLHTLGNTTGPDEPTFSLHTYIGPYTGGVASPPWAQSYVFEDELEGPKTTCKQ